MTRPIDATKLERILADYLYGDWVAPERATDAEGRPLYTPTYRSALEWCLKLIRKQPTVTLDVSSVVHAHWIVIEADSDGGDGVYHSWATLKCSACGMERDVEDDYVPAYCESCGAKMDEEEKK